MSDVHHKLAHTYTLEAVLDFADDHPDPYQTFDQLREHLSGSGFIAAEIRGEFVLLSEGGGT